MDKINLSGKKILVTGGNGYLGEKLISRLLKEKAKVFSLDLQVESSNKDVEYYKADLRNKEKINNIIQEIEPSIIYHLAASLERTRDFSNVEDVFEINLFGTINLLNALKDINYEAFIFTSTSEVYGGNNTRPPFKENDDFVPASPYSLSKYSAEMAVRNFSELHHKKFIILRLFNFYGKDMSSNFFLPQLINKLKRGENFDMTKGEQIRDFIHIDDVLQALIQTSVEDTHNEVFNVCSGKGITLSELTVKLKKYFNSTSTINFGAIQYRDNEVWEMIGDNSKIKGKLNLTITSLFDSLEKF